MKYQPIFVVLLAILFGFASSAVAQKKGYKPHFWFMIGLFFGIFGFLALWFLPKKEEPAVYMPPPPPRDMGLWYYLDEVHTQHGPVAFSEIERLWREKKLVPTSYLWQEGMAEWKKISELPEILTILG